VPRLNTNFFWIIYAASEPNIFFSLSMSISMAREGRGLIL
jgi:hypothetical protein